MIQLVDYEITLSNGERISITEFDPDRIPYMRSPDVLAACRGILERCAFAPRAAVEEAKRGYDRALSSLLRGPDGAMARANPPACRLVHDCAMASKDCTLRNFRGRAGLFPECWEYAPPEGLPALIRMAAVELGTAVGNAWRAGSYPVVVDLDPGVLGR